MFPPFLFSLQLADVQAAFVMMLFRIGGAFLPSCIINVLPGNCVDGGRRYPSQRVGKSIGG